MRRSEDGGYDTWGVTLPGGKIREFSTLHKAAMFANRMEGQTVVGADGKDFLWTGLTVVHRFIPDWTPIGNTDQLVTTCPLCGATDSQSQGGTAKFCSHGFHAPPGGSDHA